MDRDDDDFPTEAAETGSDELLSDDNLRLPESASPLVRLHAVRAWLTRRQRETALEIGEAALDLQTMQRNEPARRRERMGQVEQVQKIQHTMDEARERLNTYEEAEEMLEDCVNHITVSNRLLVEYYLMLDELVQNSLQESEAEYTPRAQALADVQHRIEHVGITDEGD
jgi:hypothetical protein